MLIKAEVFGQKPRNFLFVLCSLTFGLAAKKTSQNEREKQQAFQDIKQLIFGGNVLKNQRNMGIQLLFSLNLAFEYFLHLPFLFGGFLVCVTH